jgi:hypothetical protein
MINNYKGKMMSKFYYPGMIIILYLLVSCGTPNEPESIIGGDGGYKIVSKFSTSGNAQDVLVKDTVAYVTQGEGGLMIINIANKNNPTELSNFNQYLLGYSNKIASKDSLIFVSAGAWGLSIVDVSNPLYPVGIARNVTVKPAKGMDVMDDFVITAIGEEGFQIAKIVDINQLEPRGKTYAPGFTQAVFVTSNRNYLLVACGEMGFSIFNISELQTGWGTYPMVGWVDSPGYAEDVVSHPTLPYAFMACGTGGFFVIDYSDSANVKVVGSYSTGGYAKEVEYKDNKAYVTTGLRGLQIFDVSNLYSPVRIGTVQTKLAKGLTVDDKYVYVADEQEGLVIISIP